MTYRTDLTYVGGKLAVRGTGGKADTRKPLPPVTKTDRIASDKWGASLKAEAGVPDATLNAIADAHSALVHDFNNLNTVRETQSPELTQAAHLNQLASMTERTLTKLAAQTDRVTTRANERLKEIESEARRALGFTQRGNNAELRQILRQMDDKGRSEAIAAAINSADGELLAAVFDGVHPMMVGMTAEHHAARFDQALNKHRPDLLKLRRATEKGRDLLRDSFLDVLERSDLISAKAVREQYQAEQAKAKEASALLSAM